MRQSPGRHTLTDEVRQSPGRHTLTNDAELEVSRLITNTF